MSTFHIALAGLLLSAALPAAGPKPEKTVVRETASASLVEVPVHVISRDGKPVRGLTAADFEVEDDGRKQAITAVDVIDLN
ncbi:MAG: hypothetical protein ABR610_15490, partial [Thermoanaerobaculia bacterium]